MHTFPEVSKLAFLHLCLDINLLLDIVETMATSDNVIRAGLTPKLRDVPNLIAGLTYTASEATKHTVDPRPYTQSKPSDHSTLYDPPIPEFSVVRVKVDKDASVKHAGLKGPSIFIVTGGNGKITWDGVGGEAGEDLNEGRVFFVGAKTPVTFEGELEVYRAFVEPKPPRA